MLPVHPLEYHDNDRQVQWDASVEAIKLIVSKFRKIP